LGIGTFMRYNIDKSVTIYNEIDEVTTIIWFINTNKEIN
jgi:hypothetical protein